MRIARVRDDKGVFENILLKIDTNPPNFTVTLPFLPLIIPTYSEFLFFKNLLQILFMYDIIICVIRV